MSFAEQLEKIARRIPEIEDNLETEEATKNALVLPFIQALGYDVFDPAEVVPEFTADVGIKRGEKVDYAILIDGDPAILFECKKCGASLECHSSQLFRYFTTTSARIAVLTDGVRYRLFTDLRKPNRMDDEPFLTLDIQNPKPHALGEVERLRKGGFDLEGLLTAAERLSVLGQLRSFIRAEIESPSDSMVRQFAERLHTGRMTQSILDSFRPLVQQAFQQTVGGQVEQRLRAALEVTVEPRMEEPAAHHAEPVDESPDAEPETTLEELEAYFSVKAMLRDMVDTGRIHARDNKSYFAVLLDDNNRKPVCRFWFNGSRKYLGVFDGDKAEHKILLESPQSLFAHEGAIRESLKHSMAR